MICENFFDIPVFKYTSVIIKDNGNMDFCTTVKKFQNDIETLLKNGYISISLEEYNNRRMFNTPTIKKEFCLIFEGGFADNYSVVFPILQQYNIKASIFISTDLVGVEKRPNSPNFIPHFNWNQAQEMIDSSLVNIYPFWHPFDMGKPFLDEAKRKINLIDENIIQKNTALAFSFNDCTTSILDELNSIGVKITISDCFHSTLENLKLGMVPSIYVPYKTDIIDLLEQYKSLCKESFSKSSVQKENIFTDKISAPLNTDKIIELPIDAQPLAKNYLRHAFPLSVIQIHNKEKAKRIIFNDYIDIIYKPSYGWFDYHNHNYTHWDCIENNRISRQLLLANKTNIIDFILNALNIGYYIDIWLDIYYIPGKSEYKKIHKTHGLLIYGANLKERMFFVLTFNDKDQYQSFKVPMESIVSGCATEYFEYINLFKYNPNATIEYDIHTIRNKLYNYINSICYDDNMRYSKKSVKHYYNSNACEMLLKHTKEKPQNNQPTALYSFSEHKKNMMNRLSYIVEKEELRLDLSR